MPSLIGIVFTGSNLSGKCLGRSFNYYYFLCLWRVRMSLNYE